MTTQREDPLDGSDESSEGDNECLAMSAWVLEENKRVNEYYDIIRRQFNFGVYDSSWSPSSVRVPRHTADAIETWVNDATGKVLFLSPPSTGPGDLDPITRDIVHRLRSEKKPCICFLSQRAYTVRPSQTGEEHTRRNQLSALGKIRRQFDGLLSEEAKQIRAKLIDLPDRGDTDPTSSLFRTEKEEIEAYASCLPDGLFFVFDGLQELEKDPERGPEAFSVLAPLLDEAAKRDWKLLWVGPRNVDDSEFVTKAKDILGESAFTFCCIDQIGQAASDGTVNGGKTIGELRFDYRA